MFVIHSANSNDSQPLIGLLTNGTGGMLRMPVRMGQVTSKYDCVLAAGRPMCLPAAAGFPGLPLAQCEAECKH